MRVPRSWLATLLIGFALTLAVWNSERVPSVQPASVAATSFSAARAWTTLSMLADSIGPRVTGTPGAERALQYLAERARAIPGVEVEIQDVTGTRSFDAKFIQAYRTKNLLVRIPGRTRDAILVSSHYDSPTSSVGAVDAGVAVASMIEMIGNIAAAPKLQRTVIFNINGAEEQGLLGAHGFLRHPWIRDVKVFIDLESAGTAHKAILFQTGPGNSWLAKRYAQSAPHPYGTVLGQDIFQSGAIPSSTDFEVYRDGPHIPGVDIAFYRNGFAYHTQLDRTWNAAPGSVQHIGANALALTRILADAELPRANTHRAVYYDILGLTMLAYEDTTAVLLAVLATALAIIAVTVAKRRCRLRAMDVLLGFGISVGGRLLGLALTLAVALVPPMLFGKPHSWFAHPLLPFIGYGLLALTPLFALHGWLARRSSLEPHRLVVATWAGALILMVATLVLFTVLRIGSAYLLLWWVAPAAVGLMVFSAAPPRWRTFAVLSLIPGAVLTMQAAVLLLEFRSIGGRMPLAVPFDVVMAAIVAVVVLLLFTIPVTVLHLDAWPRRVALVMGVLGLVAVLVGALRFPYSHLRPQRLAIAHRETADSAVIRITGFDYVGPRAALRAFPNARPLSAATKRRGPYVLDAPQSGFQPARLSLVSATAPSADGTRTLTLRLEHDDAYAHQISVPGERFERWVVADSSSRSSASGASGDAVAQFVGMPDSGWTIGVVIRGAEPVMVQAAAVRAATTDAAKDLIARLPDWTSSYATVQTRRTFSY